MKKKLISLICILCMVSTYAFLPSFGSTAVMAAADDVAAFYNSDKSGVGITWHTEADTLTNNDNSSWTVSGSAKASDDWINHRTEFGLNGYDGVAMGSGVEQTVGHVGWTMSNPSGYEIRVSYAYNSNKRTEIAKWNMTTGKVTDQIDNSFVSIVDYKSYQGDFFIDLETKEYKLYFDNVLFSEGYIKDKDSVTTFKNLLLNVPGGTDFDFNFTVSNVTRDLYDKGATMNDVIAYTFKQRNENNYYWSQNGIGDIGGRDGARLIGNKDTINWASISYDSDNEEYQVTANGSSNNSGIGYTLRCNSSSCLPQDNKNDNIIHQSVTIVPNIEEGNYVSIGFKGKNGDGDSFIFDKYEMREFVNGTPYKFDIYVNNRNKKFGIKVNGEICASGKVNVNELGEILYTIHNGGESSSFIIKDVVTKSYDYTYTAAMDEFPIPMQIVDFTVANYNYRYGTNNDDNRYFEISASTIFDIKESYDKMKLVYLLYIDDNLEAVESESFEINKDVMNKKYEEVDRSYPYCLFKVLKVPEDDTPPFSTIRVKAQLFELEGDILRVESDEELYTR